MANQKVRVSPRASARERRAMHYASTAPLVLAGANTRVPTVASADTINLNYASSERVNITGTTTITTIHLAEGQRRHLTFAAALVLTYNAAKITMPGGTSITTEAGDTCEVEGVDGTIVRLYNYQRAGELISLPSPFTAQCRLERNDATSFDVVPWDGNHIPVWNTARSTWDSLSFDTINVPVEVSFTGDTTNTSAVITNVSSFEGLSVNMAVTGTGIQANSRINSMNISANTITLNLAATATGTGVSLTGDYKDGSNTFTMNVFAVNENGTVGIRMKLLNGETWGASQFEPAEMERLNGIVVNANDGTFFPNGSYTGFIAENEATYLGTVRLDGSGEIVMSDTEISIWNMYHRLTRRLLYTPGDDTWNYTTATWRVRNGGALGDHFNVVEGLPGIDPCKIRVQVPVVNNHTAAINLAAGIGIDIENSNDAQVFGLRLQTTANHGLAVAEYNGFLNTPTAAAARGYHRIVWLEISEASGTTIWSGDRGITYLQSGMVGEFKC